MTAQIIKVDFEKIRDERNTKHLVECALGLWDAGAHLLIVKDDKAPIPGVSWKDKALNRAEVEAAVSQGRSIGMKSPGYNIGLSCLDADSENGRELIQEAAAKLGQPPIVIHDSSRKKEGRCHAWWFTRYPCPARHWSGGEIFSSHTSYVVLHNLPAVYAALQEMKAGRAESVDFSLIVEKPVRRTTEGDMKPLTSIEATCEYDAPFTAERHPEAVRRIGRAVEKSDTKAEMQNKSALVIKAFRLAMQDEKDPARRAGVTSEIQRLKVFADGSWAKKRSRKTYEAKINGLFNTATPAETMLEILDGYIAEFRDECVKNGWPTPETCEGDLRNIYDYNVNKQHARTLFDTESKAIEDKQTQALNEQAATTFQAEGVGTFVVRAKFGTIDSWQQAADLLGIKFRLNTFVDKGHIWVPKQIMPRDDAGRNRNDEGKWMEVTDSLMSVVKGAIERHVQARTGKVKYGQQERHGVYLGRNKAREAIEDLFARNSYCPMKDYFATLPQWDETPRIHESMERGGMKIDAGPFTQAVQSFVWLFVVRNTMLPGSSMREYIVLHGEHDSGKSKFVELALPYHLREYWNGAFSLAGSLKQKLERSLGKALMECSEMGTGGKKNWDEVKQWLTLSDVNGERMAYKEFVKRHKLTATTVFTTNNAELPPTDDAVISRFVWANVVSPATRKTNPDTGKEERIIWHHFDELVDPMNAWKGTYREQYFAESLAFVRKHTKKLQWVERGDTQSDWRSNIPWLPGNYKSELVKWNKQAGSTFSTDQSNLIGDIDDAIGVLSSEYNLVPGDGKSFFPNMEIKAAIKFARDGAQYRSWWDVLAEGESVGKEQTMRDIKAVASDTQLANALSAWAAKNGLLAHPYKGKWPPARHIPVRGRRFSNKINDLDENG